MRLSELNIYPIKSARGISLQSAPLGERGLDFDRRWMLVDDQGMFLSQRKLPRMALIQVEIRAHQLVIRAADSKDLVVPLREQSSKLLRVRVWDDFLDAWDLGDEPAAWFSKVLNYSCKFVQMTDRMERTVKSKYSVTKSLVSFADAFPLLLISRASLDDLNSRLSEPVPMNRFRPNIVVDGCAPYEEDTWQRLRIGSVVLRVAKPCSRCTVPTVNQDTGSRGKEPIATLQSYRKRDGKVYFGQNLIHENQGTLNVGDVVEAVNA